MKPFLVLVFLLVAAVATGMMICYCSSGKPTHLYLIYKEQIPRLGQASYMTRVWGYIDQNGKVIVRPQFERAGRFADGLAAVCKGGRWGYINTRGRFVVKPRFDYAYRFSDGLALVNIGGRTRMSQR